jgi:hypothetical protein
MKNSIAVVLTILMFSVVVFSQAPAAAPAAPLSPEVEKALLPAPRQLRDAATVIRWKSDFTYDTVKKGSNRLVCYERPVQPGQPAFSVECTSVANLERVAQSLKMEAAGDPKASRAAFETAEKAGTWTKPEFGSVFYNMTGATQEAARAHTTISVPGATGKSLGLPEDNKTGGAWIMNAGTSAAHIMTPGH